MEEFLFLQLPHLVLMFDQLTGGALRRDGKSSNVGTSTCSPSIGNKSMRTIRRKKWMIFLLFVITKSNYPLFIPVNGGFFSVDNLRRDVKRIPVMYFENLPRKCLRSSYRFNRTQSIDVFCLASR